MNYQNSRRNFIRHAVAGMALGTADQNRDVKDGTRYGPICLFSKHLPMLGWEELATEVRNAGFEGIDLTVRPGGHVLPERVTEDLPLATRAIRERGLHLPMITTGLTSASESSAVPIYATAGRLGIPFLKTGYYKYDYSDPQREMIAAISHFSSLVALGARSGIVSGFHNHEGNIGAAIADVAPAIERLDQKWAGYYFDVRHAVCEGGSGGWKLAFYLAAPRLKMVAIKDFFWERTASGAWRQVNCPLGEGMVDWKLFFKMLVAKRFEGPISLHIEYQIPGRTESEKLQNTLVAAKRDLAFLRRILNEA